MKEIREMIQTRKIGVDEIDIIETFQEDNDF